MKPNEGNGKKNQITAHRRYKTRGKKMLGQLVISQNGQPAKLHNQQNEFSKTDGVFAACGIVDPGIGLKIGASITLPGASSATTITAETLVAAIKAFAIAGNAYFMGKEEFRGTKGKPKVGAESTIFGYASGPRLNGRIEEKIMGTYDKWYGNEDFYNQFVNNKPFDFFFFTNNTVHEVLATDNISYPAEDLGYPMDGNVGQGITGTFGVAYVTEGFKSAEAGVTLASLTSNDVVLTISDPTTGGTGMTAGTCALAGTKKYLKTNAGAGTITFAISPDNDCVDWAVYTTVGAALPAGYGTFSGKVLTLPNTMAAGTYTYVVTVVNKTGVKGQLVVEVQVAAA